MPPPLNRNKDDAPFGLKWAQTDRSQVHSNTSRLQKLSTRGLHTITNRAVKRTPIVMHAIHILDQNDKPKTL